MQTIGDLAQTFTMRRQTSRLNSEMTRLTNELASGRKSDPAAVVNGDLQRLGHIEGVLTRNSAYTQAGRETDARLAHFATTFDRIGSLAGAFGREILEVTGTDTSSQYDALSQNAKQELDALISAINAPHAGRSVFAGTATTSAALLDADALLTAVSTDVAGAASIADLEQAVDDWFAVGGAFDTAGYLGADQDIAPMQLGDHAQIEQSWRADDDGIRTALAAYALAAIAGDHPAAANPSDRKDVLVSAGERLLDAEHAAVTSGAEVGREQARLETALARIGAESAGLEIARTDLLSADPYETATALEQIQQQLEMAYILTSRMSELSLTRYLR